MALEFAIITEPGVWFRAKILVVYADSQFVQMLHEVEWIFIGAIGSRPFQFILAVTT